jgi:hypothetical protein
MIAAGLQVQAHCIYGVTVTSWPWCSIPLRLGWEKYFYLSISYVWIESMLHLHTTAFHAATTHNSLYSPQLLSRCDCFVRSI